MSSDVLLITSLVMVGTAILCAVLVSIYDWKSPDDIRENARLRHGAISPLATGVRGKIAFFLLYAAIAYSSDLALEWLAAVALLVLALSLVADRIITAVMVRRGITPSDPAPQAEARQAAAQDDEIVPEPMGEMLLNIAGIVVTIVAWAAVFSLVMLLCFTFFEVVVPNHLSSWMGAMP